MWCVFEKSVSSVFFSGLVLFFVTASSAHADWAKDFNGCKLEIDGQNTIDENSKVAWTGSCESGFAQGAGTVVYNYSDPNAESICEGTMQHGRLEGQTKCVMNNGNTFSGVIKNGDIVGDAVYTWKVKDCPACMRRYQGTFYKNRFSQGILTLANGEKTRVSYYPSEEGCLVWNESPQEGESVSWSGNCEGGLATGPGVLKFVSAELTETIKGTMDKGVLDGKVVVRIVYAEPSDTSIVGFDGIYSHGQQKSGTLTMGDGRKEPYAPTVDVRQELEKLAAEAMIFDMAMMNMKRSMAMSAAMADVANQASCNIDPGCMMVESYDWVPDYR